MELDLQELLLLAKSRISIRTVSSDATGNAPFVPNPDQTDSDGDGTGDAGELARPEIDRMSVPGGGSIVGTLTLLTPDPPEGWFASRRVAVSDPVSRPQSSESR